MKLLLVLSIVVAMAFAQEKYSTENDNFDIEALVNDPKKLEAFSGCFLEKGQCEPVAVAFKKDIAEAVKDACSKCNPAQKHLLKRFLEAIKEKRPQDYQEFQKKYDAEGKYLPALQQVLVSA